MTRNRIEELRAYGLRADKSLQEAKKYISSARGWGIADILGGGLLTTLIKHSKIDDARHAMDKARRDLDEFRRELIDIDLPDVDIGSFLTVADFLFDGVLADYMVQRRLKEAENGIDQAIEAVEEVLMALD